ncbi:MAG: ABC transporter ATP-binding protein [Lactobacillus sp.]|nr:ABC transporter ATP-binding protein [Lactobacillus sp.]
MKQINYKWVLKNLPVPLTLAVIILSVFSSFEGVLNGYIFGQLPKLNIADTKELIIFCSLALLGYVITYTSLYLFLIAEKKATQYLNVSLKKLYFKAAFNGDNSGDAISKITSEAKQIEDNYFGSLFMLIQCFMTIVTSAVVVLMTNLVLGLVYIALSFTSFLPSYIGRKKMEEKTNVWSESNSKFLQVLKDTFSGRFEITNFGVKKLFFKNFGENLEDQEDKYFKLNAFQFSLQFVAWLIAAVTVLLPIFIGLYFANKGMFGVTISAILTLTLTADRVVGGIRELTQYQAAIGATTSLRKVEVVADEAEDATKTENGELVIDDLSVKREDKVIFQNVNLKAKYGEKVLITGQSGVGKSTLLNTIIGSIKPASGKVTIAGKAVNNKDFVLISQKVWLFAGSLRDNLTLMQDFSDEQLMKVLDEVGLVAQLGDDILDYQIAEGGENLSGGQAQRLAIARGLLRDKQLFLLDEITSSLDKENSDQIHKLIYSLPATVLEIAHNYNEELAKADHVKFVQLTKDGLTAE